MVRQKIEIKKIENLTSRQVTIFTKRRRGVHFKKAQYEVYDAEKKIALIVFSATSNLYDYSSSRMNTRNTNCLGTGTSKNTNPPNPIDDLVDEQPNIENVNNPAGGLEFPPPPPHMDLALGAFLTLLQQAAGIVQLVNHTPTPTLMATVQPVPRRINWYSELNKANAPLFEGSDDPLDANKSIKDIEKMFVAMEVPEDKWTRLAIAQLSGSAEVWYEYINTTLGVHNAWHVFKDVFLEHHFPAAVKNKKLNECLNFKQGNQSLMVFTQKFDRLCIHVGDVVKDEFAKITMYEEALTPKIMAALGRGKATTYASVVERALSVEQNLSSILGKIVQTIPVHGTKRPWVGPSQQNMGVGSSSFKRPATSMGQLVVPTYKLQKIW